MRLATVISVLLTTLIRYGIISIYEIYPSPSKLKTQKNFQKDDLNWKTFYKMALLIKENKSISIRKDWSEDLKQSYENSHKLAANLVFSTLKGKFFYFLSN